MTVIQATSRGVKGTLSDGTVRFMVEVEPAYANDAFALFGMPGAPIVIARLTQEASIAAQQAETVAANTVTSTADDKPKGGDLARLAGMFCAQPEFRDWLRSKSPLGWNFSTTDEAAQWLRNVCGIQSRAELDHNEDAASIFHEQIRRPYAAWRKERGLEK